MNGRDHEHESNREVPSRVWRMTMHYHDLIYIKNYWESVGQQIPASFAEELARCHDRLLEILDEERGQGGAYYKPKGKDDARKS